jgi:hypothetical protein
MIGGSGSGSNGEFLLVCGALGRLVVVLAGGSPLLAVGGGADAGGLRITEIVVGESGVGALPLGGRLLGAELVRRGRADGVVSVVCGVVRDAGGFGCTGSDVNSGVD